MQKTLLLLTVVANSWTSCPPVFADETAALKYSNPVVEESLTTDSQVEAEMAPQEKLPTIEEILSKQILSNSTPFIEPYGPIDYQRPAPIPGHLAAKSKSRKKSAAVHRIKREGSSQ